MTPAVDTSVAPASVGSRSSPVGPPTSPAGAPPRPPASPARPRRHSTKPVFAALALALGAAVLVSLTLGRYRIPLGQVAGILAGRLSGGDSRWGAAKYDVIFNLRLPRTIIAGVVGAALAGAGSAYQALFRNPMVSPDILGASAGAGFGAALGILLSFGGAGIELSAFVCGVVAVVITYSLASVLGKTMNGILVLVLAGMVIGNLFIALTSGVKFVADPNSQLPEITFWLMGGLSAVRSSDLGWLLAAFAAGGTGLMALRWRLNVMSFGDDEALSLGVDVRRVRYLTIGCATLLTSSAVAVAGMVGWVGLIIPHLARILVGSDNRLTVPASMLMGASFLIVVDDLCRSIYTTEIPLTILTSFIGAPLFIFLLLRQRRL